MSITSEEFDTVIDQWKDWQSYPWGRLYYSTSHLNIQRHIGDRPIHILDVGGGNGADAIYFAKQGHWVTLVDYSAAMLAEAKEAAQEQAVQKQITFCQADAGTLQERFSGQHFDLILIHLMLQFVPDPRGLLRQIAKILAPGGLFSLIETNCYSEVYRRAFQADDLATAWHAIGMKDYPHPWFNRTTPLYSAHEMIGFLGAHGCTLAGHYGIRCICDYLPNEPKYEAKFFAELERLEHRLTGTYPYYLLARFFQLIISAPSS